MENRRIVLSLGISYDTSISKLEKIPQMIEEIIKGTKLAEVERVHFKQLGDFACIYEAVFQIHSSEYAVYMDAQQKINLAIMEAFEKQKIEMAFPTQTVYLEK